MAVVGLPPEKQPLGFGALIGGGKVLAGSNIGGIAETLEMLDFCAEHGLAAKIETIGVHEADAAYDRVVAGEVHFRAVIDTSTSPTPPRDERGAPAVPPGLLGGRRTGRPPLRVAEARWVAGGVPCPGARGRGSGWRLGGDRGGPHRPELRAPRAG